MDSKVTGTPKGVSDNGASAEDGVAKQAAGASATEISAAELTGVSPSRQATTADMDVNVTVGVEHEPKADAAHGRTERKMIPSLRALADEERATAKKARASWQMFTIMAEFIEATEYLSVPFRPHRGKQRGSAPHRHQCGGRSLRAEIRRQPRRCESQGRLPAGRNRRPFGR